MAGRPPKEDSRDKQYRVRLNGVEGKMLSYISVIIGKKRNVLEDYYNKVRVQEALQANEYIEDDRDTRHISIKRIIDWKSYECCSCS